MEQPSPPPARQRVRCPFLENFAKILSLDAVNSSSMEIFPTTRKYFYQNREIRSFWETDKPLPRKHDGEQES